MKLIIAVFTSLLLLMGATDEYGIQPVDKGIETVIQLDEGQEVDNGCQSTTRLENQVAASSSALNCYDSDCTVVYDCGEGGSVCQSIYCEDDDSNLRTCYKTGERNEVEEEG